MSTSPTTPNLLVFLYVLSHAMEPPKNLDDKVGNKGFTLQTPLLPLSQLLWSPTSNISNCLLGDLLWVPLPPRRSIPIELPLLYWTINGSPQHEHISDFHDLAWDLTQSSLYRYSDPNCTIQHPEDTTILFTSCLYPCPPKGLFPSVKSLCLRISSQITSWWKPYLPPCLHSVWDTCTHIGCSQT